MLVYSAGSGVNRVQVVLSGFSNCHYNLCGARRVFALTNTRFKNESMTVQILF